MALTKKNLINYLEQKNIYESVDDNLITELLYNVKIANQAKKDINQRGVTVNVRQSDENPYFQPNPSVSVYHSAIKIIITLSKKLGLSPEDRANLKLLNIDDLDDGFDE
ncbi:MAG: phage terminase small subunit P27 family [bacterium]